MSGGTDSSAAAAMLVDQGYEVIGLTAHMWKDGSRCCSLEDVERARKVCSYLDIRHYVVNAQEIFTDKIVDPFVEAYAAGRTPSPCIYCNSFVKFGFLVDRALQLNCDYLATGHYAGVEKQADGKYHLLSAKDPNKDQSYFLHRLNQKQLAFLLFPLADLPKPEVKAYSKERGLPIVPRGESQDLCFIEEGRLAEFVEQRDPSVVKKGEIHDPDGNVVGHHNGLHRFTVGQRGKLGIALGERMYVKRLDKENNVVEVAPRPGVMQVACALDEVHWISGDEPEGELRCEVRPRYRSNGALANVRFAGGGKADVVFDEPQFALTPGQAAVFYKDGEVLGGGWIDEAS
ncbi:tRNA-specific 2-thiouridylase MnmA [Pontiella sulfatireligans]|uniref:tRNA-specific 2-thiouridylase MnmA n=2 Tax=Pontiella sulfatireligans TaxID=2750658 RepID=A0A6C2UIG9_9BACT|nr:tRNA-specific 2-thiouridylase MnmA [Pontiella sulfatireligans]